MTPFYRKILILCVLLPLITTCREEAEPLSLIPTVEIYEATEIDRTGAVLSGRVTPQGNEHISRLTFHYGTTPDMSDGTADCTGTLQPTVRLEGLTPGTIYYYALEAGNSLSTTQSDMGQFTTHPNQIPTIGGLQRLSQGPFSIQMRYAIEDDGGTAVLSTGFYLQAEGDSQAQRIELDLHVDDEYIHRFSGLKGETSYSVQAFAVNSIGESRSEPYRFYTRQAVVLTSPGTLRETLSSEDILQTSLSIAGPLNGTDIRFLRELLRQDTPDESGRRLEELDLSDATIAEGGESYGENRYTTRQCIGYGMFQDCSYLRHITLPTDTRSIESEAFCQCTRLTALTLPDNVVEIQPSHGCSSLSTIEVATNNAAFSSIDGVLYNKEQNRLVWYPQGNNSPSPTLPATLTTIGRLAMLEGPFTRLNIPSGVTEMQEGAFQSSLLEQFVLPDRVERVDNGLFQYCPFLTSVTLSSHTGYLSSYCFDHTPLRHLYVPIADFPPLCQEESFYGIEGGMAACTLHVPQGSLERYRNHAVWGKFGHIVEEM